jgi:lysophospholipase L1-like esterase
LTADRSRKRRLAPIFALALLQLLVAAALLEGAVALLLAHTPRVPALRTLARQYYGRFDRAIIQTDPRFVRYDPELFYTLRPGRFVYAQREFAHEFRVNSLGVRDSEAALEAPEIVVLGDSVAMGWGVAQEDSFPAILARETGRRVLNTGISSYGSVREMRLLERVDRRRLAWLIVQYCANDVGENRLFLQRGHHVSGTRERFESITKRYEAKRVYYPGKYAWESVRLLERAIKQTIAPRVPRGPAPTADEEAEAFLNALLRAGSIDFDRVRLVVAEVTGEGAPAVMLGALRRRIAHGDLPRGIRSAALLDIGARLGPEAFHVLDDHPNARGHRLIADAVLGALRAAPATMP